MNDHADNNIGGCNHIRDNNGDDLKNIIIILQNIIILETTIIVGLWLVWPPHVLLSSCRLLSWGSLGLGMQALVL